MSEPSIAVQYVHEGILAAALSFGGWLILFPFRTAVAKVKKYATVLEDVKLELAEQRTNCLKTLQDQGEKQIELLEKTVEVLDKIHDSQSQMSGFLQGQKRG